MDFLTRLVASIMLLIFDCLVIFILDCILSAAYWLFYSIPFWVSMVGCLPILVGIGIVFLVFQSVIVWRG